MGWDSGQTARSNIEPPSTIESQTGMEQAMKGKKTLATRPIWCDLAPRFLGRTLRTFKVGKVQ